MLSLILASLVQSITEFLPISSSGHLLLLSQLGFSEQGFGMDILLHLGTLIAVMFYFREDVKEVLKGLLPKAKTRQLLMQLIVATLPIVIAGFFLASWIENVFRSPVVVGYTAIIFGALLWIADNYFPAHQRLNHMSLTQAFLIGCGQVFSLIPGASRSGTTMTCARMLGLSRTESARFSMLLSIPAICLAVFYAFWQGWMGGLVLPSLRESVGAVGLTFFFGFFVINFLMVWVQKASYTIFAVYRILLGIGILVYLSFT
ncbi:MAG: undecaprenyl-diphosphate phosphatase [Alphaproteobacteria bacterium]